MKIYDSIKQLIGNTPLFYANNYINSVKANADLLLKLEYLNPAGSIKDRAAAEMIYDAEEKGLLKKGGTIIEPTSGNTGIGLAAIGIPAGYRVILTMPDSMSEERQLLLKAYGAEVVLTPGAEGMSGAVKKAESLAKEIPGAFIPGQFVSPANAHAHYKTTGPEIWNDTDGKVDVLVCGVGTGGTLTGTAKYLKEKNPEIRIAAVEPASSPLLSQGISGPHGLMGIGANFIPELLDISLIDEIVAVTEEDAYRAARLLAKTEGLLVGITSGAALHAATVLAEKDEYAKKKIAVILPDTGDRYLSTPEFKD